MDEYHKGETIICEIEDRDTKTGELVDPATSLTLLITDNRNGKEVNNQDMVPDSTGKYHYDYTIPATAMGGVYKIVYTDTDGARISKGLDQFKVI